MNGFKVLAIANVLLVGMLFGSGLLRAAARPADPTWPSIGQPVQVIPGAVATKPAALFAGIITGVEPLKGEVSITVFAPGAPATYLSGVGNCSLTPAPCWVPLPVLGH